MEEASWSGLGALVYAFGLARGSGGRGLRSSWDGRIRLIPLDSNGSCIRWRNRWETRWRGRGTRSQWGAGAHQIYLRKQRTHIKEQISFCNHDRWSCVGCLVLRKAMQLLKCLIMSTLQEKMDVSINFLVQCQALLWGLGFEFPRTGSVLVV